MLKSKKEKTINITKKTKIIENLLSSIKFITIIILINLVKYAYDIKENLKNYEFEYFIHTNLTLNFVQGWK